MQAPDSRSKAQGIAQKVAEIAVIDAVNNSRHEYHTESGVRAVFHSTLLLLETESAPQGEAGRFMDAIPLQVDGIQPGPGQGSSISRIVCQAQTIGVELHQSKAALSSHADDVGKILSQGRLTTRNLNIAGARGMPQRVQSRGDVCQIRVCLRVFASGISIAEGTGHIAALRHFHKSRTGVLAVFRTKAAIPRAALVYCGGGMCWKGRGFGPRPRGERGQGDMILCFPPYGHVEGAVIWTGLVQHDDPVFLDIDGIDATQTQGTETQRAA